MTAAQFRRCAEAAVRRSNPSADVTAGYSGVLTVTAPGYRPRNMVATLCGHLVVR